MLDAEGVRSGAGEAGFAEIADDLVRLARPALVLDAGRPGRPVGRLGGLPRLPPGVGWPRTRWPGAAPAPLAFFGEVHLAGLDPSVWPGPRTGALSFFCHVHADAMYVDRGGAALVLHHPDGAPREPVRAPEALDRELLYDEVTVAARAVTTLPWVGVGPARELIPLGLDALDDLPRAQRYCELAVRLAGGTSYETPHQLLGWPRFTQDDIDRLWPALYGEAVRDGLAAGEIADEDWRLLLQVGADRRLGTSFGDGGDLFFAIPAGDLAAGRFDRVQAISDSG